MKKNLLKFLPLMAALLLATSCSKDDENNAPTNGRDGVHTVSTSTIPFSIKVNTGNSLKKIGYAKDPDNEGYYNISFTEDDEKNGLQMVIKEGDIKLGVLTLQNDLVTFSGEISVPSAQDAKLTAEITVTPADAKTYSETFDDLLKNCSHTFRGSFKYNEDKNVDLYDQNAYLAISMSPCQCYLDVKSGDADAVECKLSTEGEVWVAVPSGVALTVGSFITKAAEDVTAGKIYTISRPHCVDLGIKYTDENDENYGKYTGILWTDHNIGGTNPEDWGGYYAWGEIETKDVFEESNYKYFDGSWNKITKYCPKQVPEGYEWKGNGDVPDGLAQLDPSDDVANKTDEFWSIPTIDEFKALYDNCYSVWEADYKGSRKCGLVFYKVSDPGHAGKCVPNGDAEIDGYDYTSAPHIFLPAAGVYRGTSPEFKDYAGGYWSSSLLDTYPDASFMLSLGSSSVSMYGGSRNDGRSVRAVRRSK